MHRQQGGRLDLRLSPEPAYPGLSSKITWSARNEDESDASVWSATCQVKRPEHRRQHLTDALARPPSTSPADAALTPWRPTR
jgi:hypothetical protein